MNSIHRYTLKSSGFSPAELRAVAEIHQAEIGSGFLSSLGTDALQLLFSHISSSKSGILIAAFDPELPLPVGFICGTLDCGALYREFMLRRGLSALRIFLPRLLTPTRMRKACETLLYPQKKESASLPKAEIIDFAVRADHRGAELATQLFVGMLKFFKQKNVKEVKIVTGVNQKDAQQFYENMGAEKFGSLEIHKNQESLAYICPVVL